jgi:dTDP-4-dehydrorhamnose reductase
VEATPNPLSEYGQQKLKGECITLQTCPNAAVLRIPLLYGPIEYFKESGVTALYPDLRSGVMKKADHFQKRYPTSTNDVSMVIAKMIDVYDGGKELQGIFHWQADECLTKFDMVQLIAELEELDASAVVASTSAPPYPCPEDTRLDCSRLIQELGIDPALFRTPIRKALRRSLDECMEKLTDTNAPIKNHGLAECMDNTDTTAPTKESADTVLISPLPVLSSVFQDFQCYLKTQMVEERCATVLKRKRLVL